MQALAIAKKRKIGREVERVEIGVAVGEPSGGDPHRVEAENLRALGKKRLELSRQPLRVKSGNKYRARG